MTKNGTLKYKFLDFSIPICFYTIETDADKIYNSLYWYIFRKQHFT